MDVEKMDQRVLAACYHCLTLITEYCDRQEVISIACPATPNPYPTPACHFVIFPYRRGMCWEKVFLTQDSYFSILNAKVIIKLAFLKVFFNMSCFLFFTCGSLVAELQFSI